MTEVEAPDPRSVWARHYEFYRGSGKQLAVGIALSAVQTMTLLPVPLLVARAIDTAIPRKSVKQLLIIGTAIVGLTVISALITLAARRVTLAVTKRATRDLRLMLVDKLYSVSRQFHVVNDQGELHDRLVHESDRVDLMTSSLIADLLPAVVLTTGLLAVLSIRSPLLTLVTIVCTLTLFGCNRLLHSALRQRFIRYQSSVGKFSRGVLHTLRTQDLTRIQGAESVDRAHRAAEATELQIASQQRAMTLTIHSVSQQTLMAAVGAVILVVGGTLAARGRMSIGDLIGFYAGFALIRGPLTGVTAAYPTLVEGRQSLHRLYLLLDYPDHRPYHGTHHIDFSGHLELCDASLAYGDRPVLRGVSLRLEPGRVVALVGPNGSGKSSVVNLLLGFYRPQAGLVRADDEAYDDVDLSCVVSRLGVVPQEPFFFPGTIRQNLLYGISETLESTGEGTDRALDRALRLSTADQFLAYLPDGVDTELGDDAMVLSGGQRQRLAIARALVRAPCVLILDEPTNHLDITVIGSVLRNIRCLDPAPAVLIVSHDAEAARSADEVVRLVDGKIEQSQPTRTTELTSQSMPAPP